MGVSHIDKTMQMFIYEQKSGCMNRRRKITFKLINGYKIKLSVLCHC